MAWPSAVATADTASSRRRPDWRAQSPAELMAGPLLQGRWGRRDAWHPIGRRRRRILDERDELIRPVDCLRHSRNYGQASRLGRVAGVPEGVSNNARWPSLTAT